MKNLKALLIAIYPLLIILLILSNLKTCNHNDENTGRTIDSTTTNPRRTATDVGRRAQRVGHSGNLKVTLLWDFPGDIDLHVKQPNGREIYYRHPEDSSTGGALDVDDQVGGAGAAENIYWQHPPQGTYDIALKYYQPSQGNGVAGQGQCTVVVFKNGQEEVFTVNMNTVGESKRVATINI